MVKSFRLFLLMKFNKNELGVEAERLHDKLRYVGFGRGYCEVIAPLTLEINKLKKEKGAIVLAHSYQTPDIIYGVADFVGDSYGLSKKASDSDAGVIVFCGVKFMAETAKILSPNKVVLLPDVNAGCSLADSITAEDVIRLKRENPGVPVVVYVNTSAVVKAEADVCCTSSNALKIIEGIPGNEVIFLPDQLMAKNLQSLTSKKIISWPGKCIVHDEFDAKTIEKLRARYEGLKVMSHLECSPAVLEVSDMSGGTADMIKYVSEVEAPAYLLVTECGLSDRMRVEKPEKNFVGACGLCPYMKMIDLPSVLQVLSGAEDEQIVEIPLEISKGALKSLNKMFELTE